jgi:putative salt-induced outer membrane protein YdiY
MRLLPLAAGLSTVLADDTKPDAKPDAKVEAKPEPKKWETIVTAGVTLTRGNSDNFLATIAVGTKRKWTDDELLLGANAGYGDTTQTQSDGKKVDTTTDSYAKAYAQWNHLFSPKVYAGLRVTGDHDDIADLAYRITVSPLAGYYFIKETNTFLAGEIGPSYVNEKYFDQDADDYIGLRLGERGEYKFTGGSKIWESVEYIPKIEDFGNFLINAEIGISAPINKTLSMSLVLQDTYKSVPASGKKKNDLKLIAGLSFTF